MVAIKEESGNIYKNFLWRCSREDRQGFFYEFRYIICFKTGYGKNLMDAPGQDILQRFKFWWNQTKDPNFMVL